MMSKRKKIIVSVCLVFLLVATVYVNVLLSADVAGGDNVAVSDYFSEYRTERTTSRQEQLLNLDSIISSQTLDAEVLSDAASQKMSIVTMMDQELSLENLIQAKGFDDVVVTMSTESDDINVIVKAETLTQDEVAQIYSVIASTTEATYANVKIIPVS